MVTIEAGPGTVTVGANYLYSVEQRNAALDEQLINTELQLLCAEESAIQLRQQIANTEITHDLQRAARKKHRTQADMKWRHGFFTLCGVIIVAVWLIGSLVVIPHLEEIEGWFR